MAPEKVEQLKARRAGLAEQRAQLADAAIAEGDRARIERDRVLQQLDSLIAQIDALTGSTPARSRKPKATRAYPVARVFELARVPKTSRAEIRVSLDARKPARKVDVRLWFMPDGETSMVPSRKGVTVDAESLDALIDALVQAREHLGGPK